MVTAMLVWGPGYVWLPTHVYMGGTRGSCVLSSTCDVIEISVMKGVGGVCDMCMCLTWGDLGGEWVTELGLDFTHSGGTWGKWDVCVLVTVVLGESGVAAWAKVWEDGVVLCLCVL